jgi:isoquinoline 1-oxidoreductase
MSETTHEGLAIFGDFGPNNPGVLTPFQSEGFGYVSDASATEQRPPWLVVRPDGGVTAFGGKSDYGQGIRSGFAVGIANELRVPFEDVEVVLGDTDRVPWDSGSFGSRATAQLGLQLRKAAATARHVLLELGADRLDLPVSELGCDDGRVFSTHDPTRSVGYGELLRDLKLERELTDDVDLTPKSEFTVSGAPAMRSEAVAHVTGQTVFARDVTLPGMLYAAVLRPPSYNASLGDVDWSAAEQLPGVVQVVRASDARYEECGTYQGGDMVAVLAESDEEAELAARVVRVEWNEQPDQLASGDMQALLAGPQLDRMVAQEKGSLESGFAAADHVLESSYYIPHQATVPMEPSAAVARWEADRLTVWAGTQGPFGIRGMLAQRFGIDEEQVRVILPDGIGGAFGAKNLCPAAQEAATLARVVGRPVRVAYSRTDEMTWRSFRIATLHEVKSGVMNDGTIVAWEFCSRHADPRMLLSGAHGIQTPYDTPNVLVTTVRPTGLSPVPNGPHYRAGGAPLNAFAAEVHIDEIAEATGIDPLELRLRNLSDPRFRRVLEAAADAIDWEPGASPTGRGQGIAAWFWAGTYIATAVRLELSGSEVKVQRVVQAVDCGLVVNPEGVAQQMEGGTMMALGTTLYEAIEFEEGRLLTPGFARYQVPRITDTVQVDTVLVGDADTPSTGVGEPPVIATSAAISNALFDLTGERHRRLPIQRYLS